MKTFQEYEKLKTWKEKAEYHTECENDETISSDEYKKIDMAYWQDVYEREELLEEDICPECKESIIYDTYTDSDSHQNITEISCGC